MRRPLAFFALSTATLVAFPASAEDAAPPAAALSAAAPDATTTTLPAATPTPESILPAPPADAPPPLPRKKGLVLDASLGALGFLGQFRHVAPTAPWVHAQLGYELLDWLMLFGEGDLLFTDTSDAQSIAKQTAFPILGFGGGARGTIHATERVAFFLEASIDALKADVPTNTLVLLGFRNAESLNPSFGARIGVEWYQIDRHMALGAGIGLRDAQGFAKVAEKSDTPLMWDGSASVRYTF